MTYHEPPELIDKLTMAFNNLVYNLTALDAGRSINCLDVVPFQNSFSAIFGFANY